MVYTIIQKYSKEICLLTYISFYDISDLMSCLDIMFIHFLLKGKINTGLTSVKVDKFPARSLWIVEKSCKSNFL